MLQKLRNYVTPMVATVALAVFGATAMAVAPTISDRIGDNSGPVNVASQGQAEGTATGDVIEEIDKEDLSFDSQAELEEEVTTPTVTPTVTPADQKPNHGHYLSCVAHMAKNDPALAQGQRGAVVSFAARQDVVMAKGADCTAAYETARTAALSGARDDGRDDAAEQASVTEQDGTAEGQVHKQQAPGAARAEAPKQAHQVPAGPAQQGGHAASKNGGGAKK